MIVYIFYSIISAKNEKCPAKANRTNPSIWERKSARYPALHSYRAKIYL
jgi:hypothetical protein